MKAQLVTLDPDWQTTCDIWGLAVIIPGVLKGNYRTATVQRVSERFVQYDKDIKGYSYGDTARFKRFKCQNILFAGIYH